MQSTETTPQAYMDTLPEERKTAINAIRKAITDNLPKGFKETMGYGMLCYVVPHSIYPPGYHCNPKQALPFISVASQKNFVALYHMGIYANPPLLEWFTSEYPKYSQYKLDMGKSCIRFKKLDDIPYGLIGALAAKLTPEDWIEMYEKALKR